MEARLCWNDSTTKCLRIQQLWLNPQKQVSQMQKVSSLFLRETNVANGDFVSWKQVMYLNPTKNFLFFTDANRLPEQLIFSLTAVFP